MVYIQKNATSSLKPNTGSKIIAHNKLQMRGNVHILLIISNQGEKLIAPFLFVSASKCFRAEVQSGILQTAQQENPNIDVEEEIRRLITPKTKGDHCSSLCCWDCLWYGQRWWTLPASINFYVVRCCANDWFVLQGQTSWFNRAPQQLFSFHRKKNIISGRWNAGSGYEHFISRAEIIREKERTVLRFPWRDW